MKWHTEKRKLGELKELSNNPRTISKDGYEQIGNDLERVGNFRPLIINLDGTILGGNQRYKKLLEKHGGDYEVEVSVPETYLSEEVAKQVTILDNKHRGIDDIDILANEYEDTLKELGFDDLLPKVELEVEEDDYEEPEDLEVRVKRGEVWQLGRHRLMCGDSTKIEDVEKLMNGQKVDMVFTDPPYNINYSDMSGKFAKIANDEMSDQDFTQFLIDSLYTDCDIYYVCCSWQFSHLFRKAMDDMGKPVKSFIVWNKVNPAQNLDKYFKQHEIILYSGKFGGEKTVRGDIWEVKRQKNTVHPTMKPIELISMAIGDQKDVKNIYDAFGGSGSTLIACEQTNRKCYMMELDEHYCTVILDRWEKLTGQKANKLTE